MKRYSPFETYSIREDCDGQEHCREMMQESPNGEYVRYEDHLAAEKEYAFTWEELGMFWWLCNNSHVEMVSKHMSQKQRDVFESLQKKVLGE